jgi:MFS family permease
MLLSLYVVSAAANGGLEFNHIQKGQIYSGWAIIQSFLPIITGGYADRFGYRRTISFAILIKVIGYLLMATQTSFLGFFSGCMLLASGTALFKPAVQGLLVTSLHKDNSSIGWGIFYWLINLGGLVGPWLAGYLRLIDWSYVFYGNAIIVSINFIFLFLCPTTTKTAPKEEQNFKGLFKLEPIQQALKELFKPALISFLLIYSGFWMMYNQIFDLLPNFIDDWVDSSGLILFFGNLFHNQNWISEGLSGKQVPPEWLISLNCATIILLMIPLSWLFRRLEPIHTMIGGILTTIIGMFLFGISQSVLLCIAGIVVFSIGEMGASPRMREYLGLVSPKGKEGQYMGYANLPEAIGWGFGSLIAGYWYETYSDKHTLIKKFLIERLGWSVETVANIPKEKLIPTISEVLNASPIQVNNILWKTYHPDQIWIWFILIGLFSALFLAIHRKYAPKLALRDGDGTIPLEKEALIA